MSGRPLALVTGGCRRLGAAIAAALAGAGYDLALHGSHDAEPEPTLADALATAGGVWQGFVADFADPARATALYAEVTARFGRAPDLLVNGASLFGQDVLADVTADDLAQAHAINAAAPVLLMQAFAATMGEGGGKGAGERDRSIVNILDQRIAHPHPDQLSYTLAKLGLAGATRIGAAGVRVNGVAPGLTLPTGDYSGEQMAALADLMPLRLLPTPDDIAAAVLFCASTPSLDRQILYVDGGAHLVPFERDFVHLTG